MASAPVYTDVVFQPEVKIRAEREFRLGYRPSLDGLRAFAVLTVMANHYSHFFRGGQVGVDVFFVLSGFLITSLLLEEWTRTSGISLRNFYSRRALRLFPALLALLSVAEGFALLRLRGAYFWTVQRSILGALFYAANWMRIVDISSMGPIPHTWSLSVEEQFYLIWPPLLLLLLPRLRKVHIAIALVLMSCLVAVHRFTLWTGEGSWERIYNGTDTRFDELLVGCLASFLFAVGAFRSRFSREFLRFASLPSALFVASLPFRPMSHAAMVTYGWALIELSVAILLCWLVSSARNFFHRILELPPLVYTGQISYGLYLWHVPLFSKIGGSHLPSVLKTCLMFTATFAVAGISHRFIEKPFLRLKSRMSPLAQC